MNKNNALSCVYGFKRLGVRCWVCEWSTTTVLPSPQVNALTAKLEAYSFDRNSSTIDFGAASIVANEVGGAKNRLGGSHTHAPRGDDVPQSSGQWMVQQTGIRKR